MEGWSGRGTRQEELSDLGSRGRIQTQPRAEKPLSGPSLQEVRARGAKGSALVGDGRTAPRVPASGRGVLCPAQPSAQIWKNRSLGSQERPTPFPSTNSEHQATPSRLIPIPWCHGVDKGVTWSRKKPSTQWETPAGEVCSNQSPMCATPGH